MSSAEVPASVQDVIHTTLGAVFIGFAISCGVYGILVSQVFSYFRSYPGDRWLIKYLVVLIWVLETADQCFIGHLVYFYSILNYANPSALFAATMTWSFILQQAVGAVAGAIVKAYFGFRVWRFSERNFWVTGFILLCTLGQLGVALVFTVKAFQLPSVFAVNRLLDIGTIALGLGVFTDIVTAAALCFFLRRLRTGLKNSDSLVNSLCAYAINTGALTSAVSVTVLVLYRVMPSTNLIFVGVYFTLSKLYAISFMATLNTRRAIRGRGTDRQGRTTSNHTNMFHLGTRMPSMGPTDLEQWDKVDPPAAFTDLPVMPKKSYGYGDTPQDERRRYEY